MTVFDGDHTQLCLAYDADNYANIEVYDNGVIHFESTADRMFFTEDFKVGFGNVSDEPLGEIYADTSGMHIDVTGRAGFEADLEINVRDGSLVVSGGSLKPNYSIVLDPTSAEAILTDNSGPKSQSVAGKNRVSWEPGSGINDLILTMTGGEDGQVVYVFNTDTTYYVDVVNPTFSGVYGDYPDVPPVSSRRFIHHSGVWYPEGSSY
jgi:hypothetical protein